MKIAILDDYQQIAMQSADWGSLPSGTEVNSFAEHIADQAELLRRLPAYDVIVAMRERTRFPAQAAKGWRALTMVTILSPKALVSQVRLLTARLLP